MTNKKNTRRALLASLMALLLCFSSLMGTTYAWFTDSVTSANNVIQSGNLDVELYYQVEGQTDWTKVTAETNIFKENALWEPGHTEVVKLKVVNEGTLALKYQLGVKVANEIGSVNAEGNPFKVSDFIKYGVVEGEKTFTRDTAIAAVDATAKKLNEAYNTGTQTLSPKAESIVTMVVYMPTTVGNEANYDKNYPAPVINLGLSLYATQMANEEDSFDKTYDTEATFLNRDAEGAWLINNIDELYYFAANVNSGNDYYGETVKLTADIDLAGYIWTPIGLGDVDGEWIGFNGSFDGQNHTVSNLKVTKSGGWNGLFGLVGRGTSRTTEVISNLTVKNVTIEGTNRMTGGIVGQMYGNIENCHVENVTISAIPNATATGYDNGDKIGGIVGWHGDNGNNHYIKNCTATNVTLKAYRDVGGITGYIGSSSIVENCEVDTVSITVDQETNHYGAKDANAGAIVGRIYKEPVTVQNNTEVNVTIVDPTQAKPWEDHFVATEDITRENMIAKDYVEICHNGGNLTFNNVTFKNGLTIYTNNVNNTGTITLKNCTIYLNNGSGDPDYTSNTQYKSGYGLNLNLANGSDLTFVFENCTFTAAADYAYNGSNSYNVYIGGGYSAESITFTGCTFENSGKHAIGCSAEGDSQYYALTVTGCNFKSWNNDPTITNGAAIRGNLPYGSFAASINISGNTYGDNNNSTQKTVAIDSWTGSWN
ncbi:MAG: hypothetical protein IJW46_07580 [Clostridia bacterium]|nr:hypothetical protein [Clostridia bacterium]